MTVSDFIDDIFDSVTLSLFRVVCCAFSELPSVDFRVRISKFFSDSPREVCRDFLLSSLCRQPIQASWTIKATKLPRRSNSETSRAIQAARHQERHRLDRERREARDALRRARLYLEERKQQREKELKDQAVEQHKQPQRGDIVKELNTSKQKSPNPPPDEDDYLQIHYESEGENNI